MIATLDRSGPLPYLISRPEAGSEPKEGWPLLFFLHGYDEAAPMEILRALQLHGPLHPGNPPIVSQSFVVVAPQLPAPGGDVWLAHADAVREIVESVRQSCPIDPARRYLTGFSFGGNGVLDLGIAQPDLWAALWPVDPTRPPASDPHRPLWLSIGEIARHRAPGFIRSMGLREADHDLAGDRLFLDEGQDHVGSAALAYSDERIYRWLLRRSLPAGE